MAFLIRKFMPINQLSKRVFGPLSQIPDHDASRSNGYLLGEVVKQLDLSQAAYVWIAVCTKYPYDDLLLALRYPKPDIPNSSQGPLIPSTRVRRGLSGTQELEV